MAIRRYEPWSVLNQLSNEMNALFEPRASSLGAPLGDGSTMATSDWAPAVDIREESDRYLIHADVPGVGPKDIEINMENGVLTLKGERRTEQEQEGNGYKRIERVHGSFYRRFSLPNTADPDKVSASSNNGVLEIVIPKQEKMQPRRIEVQG